MSFFKHFPKISFDLFDDGSRTLLTDIWRYVVPNQFSDSSISYLFYDIDGGSRPDQLSQELYGSPDFAWTFFVVNPDLSDGMSAWPKSSSELEEFVDDAYGNSSVFLFPPAYDSQYDSSLDGLPINDSKFLPWLYLLTPIDSQTYAAAKIEHWDQSRYQLWVKNDEFYTYEILDSQDVLTTSTSNSVERALFNAIDSSSPREFHVQLFDNPNSPDDAADLDSQALSVAKRGEWETEIAKYGFDSQGQVAYAFDLFQLAQNAPYKYHDAGDTESEITAYDALVTQGSSFQSNNFTSYNEWEIDTNDAKRTIRVVAPDRVRTFAKDFFALINR